jgi:hypothetical protein
VVPSTPATLTGKWTALFDGKTLSCLDHETHAHWRVENGAIVSRAGGGQAQGAKDLGNGIFRFRFELGASATELWFAVRQGPAGRYTITFDKAACSAMAGKPHDLVVTCNGVEISAALDGEPVKVQARNQPRSGRFKFQAIGAPLRVVSIDFQVFPAE